MNIQDNMSYDNLSVTSQEFTTEQQIEQQQKTELQGYVKEWLKYDDEIKTLQEAIKERKKHKNDIGKILISFMDNNNIPHFNLKDGKLIFAKSEHTQPVNIQFLKNTLSESPMLNAEQYQNLFSFIESKRAKKITTRLKRTHKHDKTN
jgi:hypothetical protein